MQTCVILAGGKSSRMGQDKTLMPFGGFASLTHFQADRLAKIFKNVFVSLKFDKFNPPLKVIRDLNSEFSPMLALMSVLANFKDESVFIIPADMPFVSEKTIKELAIFKDEFDMVIARDNFKAHLLCGFFSPNLYFKAKELLENGEHRIKILYEISHSKMLNFQNEKEFLNLNTPDDYKLAIKEYDER